MRAWSVLLAVLAACGSREPRVPGAVSKPAPVPVAKARIELPEIFIRPRMRWWESSFEHVPLRDDSFDPVAAPLTRTAIRPVQRLVAARSKLRSELLAATREATRRRSQLEATFPDRAGLQYNEQLAKILGWYGQATAHVGDGLQQANVRLLALLEIHRASLTSAGEVMHAYLRILEGEWRGDSLDQLRAVSAHLAQVSGATARADVLYLQAYLDSRSERADEVRRAAATFLDVIERFPHSEVIEGAHMRAADLLLTDGSARATRDAIRSFEWLVANASTHPIRGRARYRLGLAYELATDRVRAQATFCGVIDDRSEPSAQVMRAAVHVSQDFVDNIEPLVAACVAKRCPCRDEVLTSLIMTLALESGAIARREFLELALTEFPASPYTVERACQLVLHYDLVHEPARADGLYASLPPQHRCERATALVRDDHHAGARRATFHLGTNRALRDCFVENLTQAPPGGTAMRVEVVVGTGGRVESVKTLTSHPAALIGCTENVLRRRRWHALDGETLGLRFLFDSAP